MREDLYKEMFELEESYWWHVAKRQLVKALLENEFGSFSDKTLVDVGCGTGKFLQEAGEEWRWKKLVGLDGSKRALAYCRKRGLKNLKTADFEKKLPLRTGSVDVITSLDVVEHVEKDEQLMAEFYRVLRPGGVAVITVPAYKWLWTYWDDMLSHKRRYRRSKLERKLRKSGFKIGRLSYFYSYLLPIAIAFRLLKTLRKKPKPTSDFIKVPGPVNTVLLRLSSLETKVIDRASLPAGLSIVCVAKK